MAALLCTSQVLQRYLHATSLPGPRARPGPQFSWRTCRRLLGITLLYTANTCLALFGLRSLNVPMYNVLKRLTPMMVLAVKVWAQQGKRKEDRPCTSVWLNLHDRCVQPCRPPLSCLHAWVSAWNSVFATPWLVQYTTPTINQQ